MFDAVTKNKKVLVPFIGFGTDGVRGNTNSELTAQFVLELGYAAAGFFRNYTDCRQILIGKDTRASCDMLNAALSAGLMRGGLNVYDIGVMTTPGVAYTSKKQNLPAAVISASHNPAEYNGIKFFSPNGYKLPETDEAKIEEILKTGQPTIQTDAKPGRFDHDITGRMKYKKFLESTIDRDFDGLKIGLDCANGATYHIAPDVFADLGAKVFVIGDEPDGNNINHECGSTYPANLGRFVKENNLDFGLAFDGDGDRVIAIDENGKEVDGDFIIAVLARQMLDELALHNKSVVVTVMTNIGFDEAMNKLGITVHKCAVGDRNVIDKMIETGAGLGGEQSGHIILSKYMTTGDGILTGLQLARAVRRTEKPLSVLTSIMKKFPQKLVNIKVVDKDTFLTSSKIMENIENATAELGTAGRILVRPSGTEPLIRVMAEAKNRDLVDKHIKNITDVICEELNGAVIEG